MYCRDVDATTEINGCVFDNIQPLMAYTWWPLWATPMTFPKYLWWQKALGYHTALIIMTIGWCFVTIPVCVKQSKSRKYNCWYIGDALCIILLCWRTINRYCLHASAHRVHEPKSRKRDFGSRSRLASLPADRRVRPLRVRRPAVAQPHARPTLARRQQTDRVNTRPTARPAVDRQTEQTDF